MKKTFQLLFVGLIIGFFCIPPIVASDEKKKDNKEKTRKCFNNCFDYLRDLKTICKNAKKFCKRRSN